MTVLALLLVAVAAAALTVYAKRLLDAQAAFFRDRLAEQDKADEGRRQAVYRQQKASQTVIAQQQRALEVLANESRAMHEEARLAYQRVDAHFAHPAVKALTNQGGQDG